MPYVMAGAISGLSQGILAAMERRLQREQMEQERLLRERQLELLAQQNAPVDLTNLFQLAGVQTDQPVLLPSQVAGPVVSAAAGRLFSPPAPDAPTIPSQAAEALGTPWLAGQPADVWMPVIREAAGRAFTPQPPQSQMVDLGRFDSTLAGIQVPAEQVLDNLHRLRPDVNWETQPIPQEMAQEMGMPWLAGQPMGSLPALGGFMRDVAGAQRTQEETRWIGPRTEAEIRQTLASAGLDEARTNEILATLPHTIENLQANTALTQALRDLRVQEGLTEEQMRDASIRRIDAEIARMDAETARIWSLLPHEVKRMIADTLRVQAETSLTEVRTAEAEHDLDLSRRYAAKEREENIRRLKAEADRAEVETEIRATDLQYLQRTLDERIAQVTQQRQLLEAQIQQASVELEQAMFELAMSRRLGGYNEEQARLRVEQLQEQINQLQLQNRQLAMEAQEMAVVGSSGADALPRLYELDTRQFREAGMWVPPLQDYIEFVRSGGGDWAAEVAAYNEAATSLLGPARMDDRGMSAKDHMQLARAMYEARYWLGGKGTPTFEEFLWTEYWPSYESMQFLMNPQVDATDYEFDPVLEATLFLRSVDDNVDLAIETLEQNMGNLIRSGSLTREQAEQILEVLKREKAARGESNNGFLARIWNWLTGWGE